MSYLPKRMAERTTWITKRVSAILAVVALSATPPPAAASPSGFCAELGGSWDQGSATCTSTATNAKHLTATLTARYPTDLIDDPTAGPVLQGFVRGLFERFGHPGDRLSQDGSVDLTYQTYEHPPATKSFVFTNDWYLGGPHPNDEIDAFTFDLARKKQLALADLFCTGTDTPRALFPFVKQYVQPQVDPRWVQPDGPGVTYASGYKAWALDGDDLVILMPDGRTGPVHAGAFTARIPLTALRPILREGGCST
ncbi:Immunogenic protein MPB64 [Mycobacterium talmoniae]|uniref:Immunogenic protein MPB64 n=1 Tax=Mycobacterium talmoniae TaxID=1858794 RepID=A0A2S8BDE9_9MYCO|nr:RsiV family protein [Mycobacterium eburneum]PQM44692.1 Immunogenic protein MPB64 [Mycobacterium talmoniae]TDH57738.1 DUF3298 domain-containing protein [Mycobacterium eburneum]